MGFRFRGAESACSRAVRHTSVQCIAHPARGGRRPPVTSKGPILVRSLFTKGSIRDRVEWTLSLHSSIFRMGLALSQSSTNSLLACSRLSVTSLDLALPSSALQSIGLLFKVIINLLGDILVLIKSTTLFMLSPIIFCVFFFCA